MQSCLGIYIEKNLIKYAKVQKERDNIKVEAFGTKFYENIEKAIEQIVAETNSTKLPISMPRKRNRQRFNGKKVHVCIESR